MSVTRVSASPLEKGRYHILVVISGQGFAQNGVMGVHPKSQDFSNFRKCFWGTVPTSQFYTSSSTARLYASETSFPFGLSKTTLTEFICKSGGREEEAC